MCLLCPGFLERQDQKQDHRSCDHGCRRHFIQGKLPVPVVEKMLEKIHAVLRVVSGYQVGFAEDLEAVQKGEDDDGEKGREEIGEGDSGEAFPLSCAIYFCRIVEGSGDGAQPRDPEHDVVTQVPPDVTDDQDEEGGVGIHPVDGGDGYGGEEAVE